MPREKYRRKKDKFREIEKDAARTIDELRSLRDSIFEYVGESANGVYGRLKEGKTEGDRVFCNERLIEFYQIKTCIENREEDSGFKSGNLFKFGSGYLFGDVESLKQGRSIPDFSWNSGEDQVD
ncbi:NleF caspase inhibitor [Burkholderia ubonensis]|uniref:NleF caspase inhibitor n=1 Tax=Burkholderia ubonensis TaxID=101571 RepID=UPI0011608F40|nr:NleF caspase inhibitor [Burkholderia ubonensis]